MMLPYSQPHQTVIPYNVLTSWWKKHISFLIMTQANLALWSAFKAAQRCIDCVKKRCLNNPAFQDRDTLNPAVGLSNPAPEIQLPVMA